MVFKEKIMFIDSMMAQIKGWFTWLFLDNGRKSF